ncbi:MAG: glucosamine-6-phosphate deaminase [Planctomycetota bacterium]
MDRARLMRWTETTPEEAAEDVAGKVCAWAEARAEGAERGALLLPTGSSPKPLYAELRKRAAAGALDASAWKSFNLDEYWPCPAESPISFRTFMEEELIAPLGLGQEQIGFLDGACAVDQVVAQCAAYEQTMADAGGIDLAILGVGVNGHLAFNEPGTLWGCRTRMVTLEDTTRARPGFPGGVKEGPEKALSVGIGTILEAREIVVLAFGEAKQEALQVLRQGSADLAWPVTSLLAHGAVTVYCDPA